MNVLERLTREFYFVFVFIFFVAGTPPDADLIITGFNQASGVAIHHWRALCFRHFESPRATIPIHRGCIFPARYRGGFGSTRFCICGAEQRRYTQFELAAFAEGNICG